MQVLVLGAYGLIGFPVVGRLIEAGHRVTGLGRAVGSARVRCPRACWVEQDIAELTHWTGWRPYLLGVDAVVNASGALQDGLRDKLQSLQSDAIRALFEACVHLNIHRVVQISAVGVSADAPTPFFRTKAEADKALMATDLDWTILRPGLVIAPQAYGGAALLRALAAFPVAIPVMGGGYPLQTVGSADVAEAVLACIDARVRDKACYDLVEDRQRTLAEVLGRFQAWLGFPPARVLPVPRWTAQILFGIGDALGRLGWRTPLRTNALRQIELGVTGDPAAWRRAGGATISSLEEILDQCPATVQDRWFSRLWLLKPIIAAALGAFWLFTGLIALAQIEAVSSVLAGAGLSDHSADGLVISGALLDIALGLGIFIRGVHRAAAAGMVLATLAYLVFGTLFAPMLWTDPFGTLTKSIPAAVLALVSLAIAEER